MQTRKSIFLYTALFYTLYIIFPLFGDIARLPVWLPSMLVVAVLAILYPKVFANNKVMKWFWVYAVVLGLYVIIGKPLTIGIGSLANSKKIFVEFAYILPTIGVFSIFNYLKDHELAKKYVIWSVIILYASFIVAVPLMVRYNSLREALRELEGTLSIPGLPGYGLMHAYTLFIPAICYAVKMNVGYKRWLWIAGLVMLLFVVYSTFVTTSLIIALAIIVLAFTYNGRQSSTYWFTLAGLAILFFILYEVGVFVSLIDAVYPWFEGTPVEPKLDDFRASMVGGELQGGTIESRQRLHGMSWEAFFNNPIWGTPKVGGHSTILDRFGGLGILGGLPFLMIFISFYQIGCKWFLNRRVRFFFRLGILAGMIYLYQKGNWGAESWLMLMVMMPLTIWVLSYVQEKRNI